MSFGASIHNAPPCLRGHNHHSQFTNTAHCAALSNAYETRSEA